MTFRVDEDILPITDFVTSSSEILQQLRDTRRPIVLTKEDRGIAVLVDASAYAAMQEKMELLESICRAQSQLENGQGIPHEEARARLLANLGH